MYASPVTVDTVLNLRKLKY